MLFLNIFYYLLHCKSPAANTAFPQINHAAIVPQCSIAPMTVQTFYLWHDSFINILADFFHFSNTFSFISWRAMWFVKFTFSIKTYIHTCAITITVIVSNALSLIDVQQNYMHFFLYSSMNMFENQLHAFWRVECNKKKMKYARTNLHYHWMLWLSHSIDSQLFV